MGPFDNRMEGHSLYLSDPELAEASMADGDAGIKGPSGRG